MANVLAPRGRETNVGTSERIGSTILGAVLIGRALLRPSLGRLIAGLGGAALLERGLTGHCRLYEALGLETAERVPERREAAAGGDPVDMASDESFPASDPPSWTPICGPGASGRPAPR